MRIGIDARLYYYQPAGIGHYTLRLLQALDRLIGDDQIVALRHWKQEGLPRTNGNVRWHSLVTPCHHRFEQALLSLELFPCHLDLIHSPDFIPPFRRRCPAVITVHDLAFLRYRSLLTKESARYYGQIERAVHDAEGIIAVSEATKRDLVTLVRANPEQVTVVYEAADPSFHPLSRTDAEARFPGDWKLPERFVLFVGTMEPRKNLSMLLRAILSEASLPIVVAGGSGWLNDEATELLTRPEISGRVYRLGPVSPDQLVGLYNCARLLALPSLYEGFGLSAVEAMACGTPVVASRAGSLSEVVGEAGLLLDPEDEPAWRESLLSLFEDDQLHQEYSRRGLKRAAEFSWDRAATETLALYRRIVGH